MVVAFLAFNAVLYAVFSVWCALAPEQTSTFLGLVRVNPAGESEYLAVYGGLQAGFAAFYALAAFLPDHRRTAVLFSLLLYGGIVLFRSVAVVQFGFATLGAARFAYLLEIGLLAAATALTVRSAR